MVNPVRIPVSRRVLRDAVHQVYLAGPRAAGVDNRLHQDVFGDGPGSVHFTNTVAGLCAHRHDYLFSACRQVEFREVISRKSRVIGVPTVRDRVGQQQRHLSISRSRYGRLLATDTDAVALHLGQHARTRVAAPRRFNG